MARIALVDDDAVCSKALGVLLQEAGHDPIRIPAGVGVLESLQAQSPDLVVLDVHMPGLDGLQVLQQLRHHPSLGQLPVVIFSGESDQRAQAEAHRLGAQDYIVKGQDWTTLQRRLEAPLRCSATGAKCSPAAAS